jgi:hypothetical protein
MSWAKRTEPVISIPLERTLVGVAIGEIPPKRADRCNRKEGVSPKTGGRIGENESMMVTQRYFISNFEPTL